MKTTMTKVLAAAMMAVAMVGCGNPDTGLGSTGEQGPKGETGAQGPKGDRGATGEQGQKGAQGDVGANGAQGEQGPAGPAGAKGATGAQGPQGNVGFMGPQGPQGPQGATGTNGAQGPQGAKGADGATGPKGADGATGPAGAQGAAGPMGPQGPAGADGAGPLAVGDTYVVTQIISVTQNQTGSIDAFCQPGDVLMSGSCDLNNGVPMAFYSSQNAPYIAGSQGWKCSGMNPNGVPVALRASAVCYATP
jgi:hypothetical protein